MTIKTLETPVKGIDISYANPDLDYKRLKAAGIEFAIVRTGYRQKTDDLFHAHMKGAMSAGIKTGAYVYCMAKTPAEARKEAEYALGLLKAYNVCYPVCYDIEDSSIADLSKTKLTNIALAFLKTVEEGGYRAALYANPSWLLNKLDKDKILDKYDLWLAHWTEDPDTPSKYQFGQTMWQWGAAKVDGSRYNLDCDLCYADYPELLCSERDETNEEFIPKIGETVYFEGGRHYGSSTSERAVGKERSKGTAKVTNIALGTSHPYHLIGISSNVYGWVNKNTVRKQ